MCIAANNKFTYFDSRCTTSDKRAALGSTPYVSIPTASCGLGPFMSMTAPEDVDSPANLRFNIGLYQEKAYLVFYYPDKLTLIGHLWELGWTYFGASMKFKPMRLLRSLDA
jgi:hypothetical protein